MAVTLVGEVVNSADSATGYSAGGISGDDDFVEGAGALGLKISATTTELYTTSLGATAPYDFSSGGGEFGYHIIMWFNTKTPVNATTGLRIVVGNGTSRGNWYVVPFGFYKGGFITATVNTARNFDVIQAGSWTTGGNPAQLSNVTQMGGGFTTTTSIMGSFNNCQIDQITIGLGLRVDAGTGGSPNTFETVRAADEDTNFWGWWSSVGGSIVGKGKLYIGPASGSATSVFSDSAFKVEFANQRVASTFYEINTRGSGTDVTWDLANISSAAPASVRWGLTVQSDTNSFSDTNGVWSGAGNIVLSSNSTLTSTSLINCTSLTQNSATLDGITVLSANTTDGTAFISSNNPANISNCQFNFSDGHAIVITAPGTYSFSANSFTGYGANGTNDAAIYNNSGGSVTLNIIDGGDTPTVRNGASALTTVNNTVTVRVTVRNVAGSVIEDASVRMEADTGGPLPADSSITITRSGSTATVSHTGHGLSTGAEVIIRGASQDEYNGLYTITNTGANSYTYTVSGTPTSPATGTITSTGVILTGSTNASGVLEDTGYSYVSNQPVRGVVRKATTEPYYKTSQITGSITSSGFNSTILMILDQ